MIDHELEQTAEPATTRRAAIVSIKNPFAETPVGVIVHAEEAHSRGSSSWLCPGCKKGLLLKRSVYGRPFFAHRAEPCGLSFETALHLFAKQVICEDRAVLVPEYRVDGEVTSSPALVRFTDASMETADERALAVRIVPDCTLRDGQRTLYVEVRVTHAVNEAKELKVHSTGTSMIEIVLSRTAAADMDVESLRKYVLENATRHWIVNAAHAEHERRLRRRQEAAADRATTRVHEIIKNFKAEPCPNELVKRYRFLLSKSGLGHLVGLQSPYPHWFRFSERDWQTCYLGEMLFDSADPKRSPALGETFTLRRFNFRFLGDSEVTEPAPDGPFGFLNRSTYQAPIWFNIELISEVEKGRRDDGAGPRGFGNPTLALKHYQDYLYREGNILCLEEDGRYCIKPEVIGAIWRAQRLQRLLWQSIPSRNLDFKRSTTSAWLATAPPGYHRRPEQIAAAGGEEWSRLEAALIATSQLVNARHPQPITELLGLPLFRANEAAKVSRTNNPRHNEQEGRYWQRRR